MCPDQDGLLTCSMRSSTFCVLPIPLSRKHCISPLFYSIALLNQRLSSGQDRSLLQDHLAYYFHKLCQESSGKPPEEPLLLSLQLMGLLKFQFGESQDISEYLKQFKFHTSEVLLTSDAQHKEECANQSASFDWFAPSTKQTSGSCAILYANETTFNCENCGHLECTVTRKFGDCFILEVTDEVNFLPLFIQIRKDNLIGSSTEATPVQKSRICFHFSFAFLSLSFLFSINHHFVCFRFSFTFLSVFN